MVFLVSSGVVITGLLIAGCCFIFGARGKKNRKWINLEEGESLKGVN